MCIIGNCWNFLICYKVLCLFNNTLFNKIFGSQYNMTLIMLQFPVTKIVILFHQRISTGLKCFILTKKLLQFCQRSSRRPNQLWIFGLSTRINYSTATASHAHFQKISWTNIGSDNVLFKDYFVVISVSVLPTSLGWLVGWDS